MTFSCEGRRPLLGRAQVRDIAVESLASKVKEHECALFAWVIMPEHVHLIVRPQRGRTLAEFLESFKKSVAWIVLNRWRELDAPILRQISDATGRARFWLKGGGFDRNIRNDVEFARETLYVHRNPVARGLAESPHQWRWSSASWWLGDPAAPIECHEPTWIHASTREHFV